MTPELWKCDACGGYSHKSRDECFDCGRPKPQVVKLVDASTAQDQLMNELRDQ